MRLERLGVVAATVLLPGAFLVVYVSEGRFDLLVRSWRAEGRPLRGIAHDLNAKGYRTRSGAAWRHEYVVKVLRA